MVHILYSDKNLCEYKCPESQKSQTFRNLRHRTCLFDAPTDLTRPEVVRVAKSSAGMASPAVRTHHRAWPCRYTGRALQCQRGVDQRTRRTGPAITVHRESLFSSVYSIYRSRDVYSRPFRSQRRWRRSSFLQNRLCLKVDGRWRPLLLRTFQEADFALEKGWLVH